MSDHLTQTQIVKYSIREVSAIELRSVLDHLSVCEICRRRIEREAAGDVEYLELREELAGGIESPIQSAARVHLSFDEIAGFVDGTLTGEELQVLEDHLSCCEECGLAVNDIEAFKTQLAPGQDYEYRPSSLPGDPVESKWRRLSSPFLEWKSLASALAALLLAVGVWLVWREWQAGGTKPAITNVIPSGSPAATPNPSPESSLVVMLNDGAGRVMLDREGKLTGVEKLPPAYQRMIERALTAKLIERSTLLADLTGPGGKPRGTDENGGDKFSVEEPVGEVTISDRPTFRWSQLDGAANYQVEVYNEKLERVATSPPVVDHSWTAEDPLKRGEIYFWQVKAARNNRIYIAPNPPMPQSMFRVLDQARTDELSRARHTYGSSHLTMGLLYAQAGVLGNAEQEFHALQRANPDSAIAGQLLKQVRKMKKESGVRSPESGVR